MPHQGERTSARTIREAYSNHSNAAGGTRYGFNSHRRSRCGLMDMIREKQCFPWPLGQLSAFFLFRVHDARARDLPSLWWLVLAYM